MKKLLLSLACLLFMSVAAVAATVEIEIGTNPSGNTSTQYLTTQQTFTIDGVAFAMNNYNPSNGQIRGNQSSATSNFYLYNTSAISGTLKSVTIKGLTYQSNSKVDVTKCFISTGDEALSAAPTSGDNPTINNDLTEVTWTDLSGTYFSIGIAKGGLSGTVKMTGIVIEYETSGVYVAAPTFTPGTESKLLSGDEVILACATEGATIYYATQTEVGADPEAAAVVAENHSGTSFSVTAADTYYAVAVKDGVNSAVSSATYTIIAPVHAGTEADPYDVADAILMAEYYGTAGSTESYYVEGYVSSVANFNSGAITYFIKASEGLEGDSFEIYNGKGIDGAAFENEDDIQVYDKVMVCGQLKLYGSTKEMVNGNLVSLTRKADPEIEWNDKLYTYTIGETATLPDLSNPHNLTLTYDSSDPTVATISAAGVIEVLTTGTTTLTATFAGNAQYKAAEATCELTVKSAMENQLFIDFTDADQWEAWGVTIPDAGKGTDLSEPLVKDCITISFTNGSTNTRLWNSNGSYSFRIYKNGTLTLTAAPGTKIVSYAFGSATPTNVNAQSHTIDITSNATYTNLTITYEPLKVSKFDDDTYFAYPVDYTAAEGVTYVREITDATKWAAITVPFAVPNAEWASEYDAIALSGINAEGTSVIFEDLTTEDLAANTPYLIKPKSATATEIAFILTGAVEVSSAKTQPQASKDGVVLSGNYQPYVLADGQYALAGGEFLRAEGNKNALKPFRAYLTLASNLKSIRIQIGDESGIEGIAADAMESGVFYDLQGREVLNPTKGMYIFNGQKVIIK